MPTDPDEPKLPGGVTVFGALITLVQLVLLGAIGCAVWGRPHLLGDFSVDAYGPAGVCVLLLGGVNSYAFYHVNRVQRWYFARKDAFVTDGREREAYNKAAQDALTSLGKWERGEKHDRRSVNEIQTELDESLKMLLTRKS